MTELERKISTVLAGKSKVNRLTMENLMVMTGKGERQIRIAIANLQERGYEIVSLDNGYWMGSREEQEIYDRRELTRAYSILRKIRTRQKVADGFVSQMELSF